jgi:hypothetical protein
MWNLSKLYLSLAIFFISVAGHAQELTPEVIVQNTVALSTPVHFSGPEGEKVLVPEGAYWVIPGTESLDLFRVEDGATFTIRVVVGEASEDLVGPMALSTPGTDEEPDVHSILYIAADGSQLIAEGTYSGIEARGRLADAARRRAAQARAKAQQVALQAKRRAQAAAAEVQRRIQLAAANARRNARADLGRMLEDIANTEASKGRTAALAKAARYAPRMTVASAASLTPRQKLQVMQAARRELRNRMPFIKEVFGRMTTIRPLLRDGRDRFSKVELATVREAIFGSGDNALPHPFANGAIKTRGVGDGINPSWSIGGSVDISAVAGLSLGAAQSFAFNPADAGTCTYVSAGFDLGAQEEVDVSGNVGFYLGGHDTLGASSLQGWLDGFEVAVNLGAEAGGGVEVTLLFSIPSEDLAYIPLTGISLGLAGGEAVEAAIGIGYGIRLACL